ncbi:helix-turn-helix domain-containing protein [Cellulosimicrobium sp. PMB13]|uniref:helix-turn-helix domain-containing protein n=1 Tax=Cellulosimicrobium sp. PMB13 TaxID=3120158 RepID=UPI003F4C5E59
MDLATMLGIDTTDPLQERAAAQVAEDQAMLDTLVAHRRQTATQQQIADLMGISQAAVARIEAGNRDPRISTLRRYAVAVGKVVRHSVANVADPGCWSTGRHEVRLVIAGDTGVGNSRFYTEDAPLDSEVLQAETHDHKTGVTRTVRVSIGDVQRVDMSSYAGSTHAAV